MTPEQVKLVQKSWQLVMQSSDELPNLFYDKLFELNPELKSMFSTDLTKQHQMFVNMLNILINGLDNLELILGAVKKLGVTHTSYGVKDKDYDTVGEALIYALNAILNNTFADSVSTAWTAAYAILADTMKDAAANAK